MRLEAVFGRQLGGPVLQFGSPQAPVGGVILPVDPPAAVAAGIGKGLDHGGIHAGVRIQRLFDVDDEGVPALLRQGQRHQLFAVEHPAADKPGLVHQPQHLLRQLQLIPGLGVISLGELRLIVGPELPDRRFIRTRQAAELRVRAKGAELLNVVPLTGIPPSGKELQVLPVVHIVPPGADIADTDVRVAGQQPGGLALRYHRDHRGRPLLQAVLLDGGQSGVLVPLGAGHRVVEYPVAVMLVPHHQAPGDLRPGGMQHGPPHQLCAHRILAEAVLTVLVIFAQLSAVLLGHCLELNHNLILFFCL